MPTAFKLLNVFYYYVSPRLSLQMKFKQLFCFTATVHYQAYILNTFTHNYNLSAICVTFQLLSWLRVQLKFQLFKKLFKIQILISDFALYTIKENNINKNNNITRISIIDILLYIFYIIRYFNLFTGFVPTIFY